VKECVNRTKFWTCRDSVVAFWEAKKKYPNEECPEFIENQKEGWIIHDSQTR
jgi:hypothetical protein